MGRSTFIERYNLGKWMRERGWYLDFTSKKWVNVNLKEQKWAYGLGLKVNSKST